MGAKQAREKLARDGILVERMAVADRQSRFPADARAMVYRELGALLAAGFPLIRAFETLINSPEMRRFNMLLAGARDSVREGKPLAAAFRLASEAVTPLELAVIEAGEQSAAVSLMLDRLADFLEEQERLRESALSAMIYPSIVAAVGVFVAALMLAVLAPRAQDMLAGIGAPMPRLTRLALSVGETAAKWGWLCLGVPVAAVLCARRKLRGSADAKLRWDKMLFRMPVLGRGYGILVNLRFARTLAILVQGGVSLIDAVVLAGRATGSAFVAQLAESEAETIRHGSSLSDAIRRIPPLSQSLPGWIQVGEAGGELERLLECAAQRYENHWNRFITRCLSLLEPLLILAVGVFVLLITMAVLLPVLSITRGISGS